MKYEIKFAPCAKLFVVIDTTDHCRPVRSFETQQEAEDWVRDEMVWLAE